MKRSLRIGLLLSSIVTLTRIPLAKAQTIHTVSHGEYLWLIANRYGVTVQDLKDWNQLTSNYLRTGDQLLVSPVSVAEKQSESQAEVNPAPEVEPQPAPSSSNQSQAGYYVVQPGDYLYKIARQFGITVNELKAWNHLTSNYIYAGNKLLVHKPSHPVNQSEPEVSQATTPQSQTPSPSSTSQYYTVRKGDYLYKIARQYGVTLQDLKEWNHLTSNYIYVGNRLIVSDPKRQAKLEQEKTPTSEYYDVVAGDTLTGIARKFKVSQNQIMAWNHMKNRNVYIGDRLFLKPAPVIKIKEVNRDLPVNILEKTLGGPLSEEAHESLKQMKVSLIGDSIAYSIQDILAEKPFAAYNYDAKMNRRWEYGPDKSLDGLHALKKMADQGHLYDNVVFILGTNYGASQDQLDQAMSLLGPNRRALFVDTASEVKVRNAVNQLYVSHSQKYPNAYYVDWSNPALKQFDWLYGQEYSYSTGDFIRLHPNNIGRPVLADYIVEALHQVNKKPLSKQSVSPENPARPSSPVYYTIQPGDYLYKIARMYGTSVDKLRQWNNLSSNYIYAGDQLLVKP